MSRSLNTVGKIISFLPTPVVWYKFNSNILEDSSGNGYILINATSGTCRPDFTKYRIGNASVLLESENIISLQIPTSIDIYNIASSNGISFAFWILCPSSGFLNNYIILQFSNTNSDNIIKFYREPLSTRLIFAIEQKNISNINTSPDISVLDNKWHHIVWTISSSGIWTIYVDNVKVFESLMTTVFNTSYNSSFFGGTNTSIANIDDFRIYNKVLTLGDVASIYFYQFNGIINTNTSNKLNVCGNNMFPLKVIGGILLGTQDLDYAKCAVTCDVTEEQYDQGNIVFLNRGTSDNISCDINNEILRITNSNIGIANSMPNSAYKLDVGGSINATNLYKNGIVYNATTSSVKQWDDGIQNTLTTNSNIVIGSNILGNNALEIYNGEIYVTNGNIQKIDKQYSFNAFTPRIWYTFDDIVTTGIITDKNNHYTPKINLYNVNTNNISLFVEKVSGYTDNLYLYPSAYSIKFSQDGLNTAYYNDNTSSVNQLIKEIYNSREMSISFILKYNILDVLSTYNIFNIQFYNIGSDDVHNLFDIALQNNKLLFGYYKLINASDNTVTKRIGLNSPFELQNNIFYKIKIITKYNQSNQTISINAICNSNSQSETISYTINDFNMLNATYDNVSLYMRTSGINDGSKVYIQDLRVFLSTLNKYQIDALDYGYDKWPSNYYSINSSSNYTSTWTQLNPATIYYNKGSVGINTNIPITSYKLDVNGIINSTSLYINNQIFDPTITWSSNNNLVYTMSNVSIGSNIPVLSSKLNVTGNANIIGNITCDGEVSAFVSDIRLKNITENIQNGLEIISSLSGFRYKFNNIAKLYGLDTDKVHIGVSAQEVAKVIPEIVHPSAINAVDESNENYLSVEYDKMIPILISGIKQLVYSCEELEKELKELEHLVYSSA